VLETDQTGTREFTAKKFAGWVIDPGRATRVELWQAAQRGK